MSNDMTRTERGICALLESLGVDPNYTKAGITIERTRFSKSQHEAGAVKWVAHSRNKRFNYGVSSEYTCTELLQAQKATTYTVLRVSSFGEIVLNVGRNNK